MTMKQRIAVKVTQQWGNSNRDKGDKDKSNEDNSEEDKSNEDKIDENKSEGESKAGSALQLSDDGGQLILSMNLLP